MGALAATAIYSTSGAEKTLPASGAWEYTSALSVADRETICLHVAYDPAATGGYPVIIPFVSYADAEPAAGADSWFALPASDGLPASTTYTGAVPSGADYTFAPGFGQVDVRALAVRPMAAAAAASNEVRQTIAIDLRRSAVGARWIQFAIAEVGATGSPGAALITATAA